MKINKKMTAALLLIIIIMGALAGCSGLLGIILPMDIEERIAAFSVIISNPDRTPTEILLNFGPSDDMEYYDSAKYDTYWDDNFPDTFTYAFTVSDDADLNAATVDGYLTVEVDGLKIASSGGELPETYSFVMYEEASGNWLISAIYEDPEGANEDLIKQTEFTE